MNDYKFLQSSNKARLLTTFQNQFGALIPPDFERNVEEYMKDVFYNGNIIYNRNPDDQEVIDELNKEVIARGIQYIKEYEQLQQKIGKCTTFRDRIIEIYQQCRNKEHFYELLKEYFGVDELTNFIEEVDSGLISQDQYYTIVKEYLGGLVISEPIIETPRCSPLDDIYIHLDTRNRNLQQFPKSTHFRFDFIALDDQLKARGLIADQSKIDGVSKICITNVSFNSHWKARFNKFFYIDVSEIKGFTYPTSINGHNVFGVVIKLSDINDYYNVESCKRVYATPISLTSLTIKVLDFNLAPVITGPDAILIIDLLPDGGGGTQIVLECDSEVEVGDRIYLIDDPTEATSMECQFSNTGYIVTQVIDPKNLVIAEDVVVANYTGRLLVDKYQWASLWQISFC